MNRFKGTTLHIIGNDTRYYLREAWRERFTISITVALTTVVIALGIIAEVVA